MTDLEGIFKLGQEKRQRELDVKPDLETLEYQKSNIELELERAERDLSDGRHILRYIPGTIEARENRIKDIEKILKTLEDIKLEINKWVSDGISDKKDWSAVIHKLVANYDRVQGD